MEKTSVGHAKMHIACDDADSCESHVEYSTVTWKCAMVLQDSTTMANESKSKRYWTVSAACL